MPKRIEYKLRKLDRQASAAGAAGAPGLDGEDGADGTNGTNGTNGVGVPIGGTTGQVLSKINATDYNTEWTTPSAGGLSDGDKGDISVTSSGATWTIDSNVVSLSKMADVATATVFYRKTAATGDPEVQTLATLKTDLGLTGTNSGDQTITLSGDVSGSGTGSISVAIGSGVIVNDDINASAGIALSKLVTDPLARANHTGTQSADTLTDGTTNKAFLATERTKLSGIATGATANSSDATLLDRANHTGTQLASTVSDFSEAVDDRVATLLVAGSNVTLTYNDGANSLTVASTGGGGVSDGDKGDIVVSGSGTVWTLDAGVQPVSVVVLTADKVNATTTGEEVTGLQKTLVAGTYVFTYYIRYTCAATTTGIKFGLNYAGTDTTLISQLRVLGTGTSAVTGTADQNAVVAQIWEGYAARTASTTAPNLGPTLGVDTLGVSTLAIIEGLLICTDGGDLELWHAAEVASSTAVKEGSSLIINKVA